MKVEEVRKCRRWRWNKGGEEQKVKEDQREENQKVNPQVEEDKEVEV